MAQGWCASSRPKLQEGLEVSIFCLFSEPHRQTSALHGEGGGSACWPPGGGPPDASSSSHSLEDMVVVGQWGGGDQLESKGVVILSH